MKWLNSARVNNSFPRWYSSDNFLGVLFFAAYLNPDEADMLIRKHIPVAYFTLHIVVFVSAILFACNVAVLTFLLIGG